jgi:tRNA(fMet)-specific endonuclease VapC
MSEAVFDTSILVDHLRNFKAATNLMEQVKNGFISGYISVITLAELLAGKDAESPAKRELLENLLSLFTKIEVSEEIAKTAGEIRRRYSTNIIDAVIAATAVSLRCPVLTQNTKDFSKIKEITAEKPY